MSFISCISILLLNTIRLNLLLVNTVVLAEIFMTSNHETFVTINHKYTYFWFQPLIQEIIQLYTSWFFHMLEGT